MLNNYGRGQKEFDLWYGTKGETMQFIKSMKLRLACPFNFENYVSRHFIKHFVSTILHTSRHKLNFNNTT